MLWLICIFIVWSVSRTLFKQYSTKNCLLAWYWRKQYWKCIMNTLRCLFRTLSCIYGGAFCANKAKNCKLFFQKSSTIDVWQGSIYALESIRISFICIFSIIALVNTINQWTLYFWIMLSLVNLFICFINAFSQTAVVVIIFWDSLIFCRIFHSP